MAEKLENVRTAESIAKEILDKIPELPERAEEFAISVEQKTTSIMTWIHDNEHATEKQINSLQNMNAGVDRWLR